MVLFDLNTQKEKNKISYCNHLTNARNYVRTGFVLYKISNKNEFRNENENSALSSNLDNTQFGVPTKYPELSQFFKAYTEFDVQ